MPCGLQFIITSSHDTLPTLILPNMQRLSLLLHLPHRRPSRLYRRPVPLFRPVRSLFSTSRTT